MRRAIKQSLGALTTYRLGVDSYDSAKLGLGPNIFQQNGGGELSYAGPMPVALARPMEQSTAIAAQFPWAMQWQNNTAGELDWIFLADLATAAATRRITAYTLNRRTGLFTWKGWVTVTFPGTSEAKTVRAMRMTYRKESTGTAAASGTAVTGNGSAWQTNRACVGNRIGWPSTPGDASTVSTWYEISAIGSDTSITLTASAGTIADSNYIIEDLRCVYLLTSVTTSNGGVYVIKGLNFDQFSNVGGTVPAGVSTDNIRASYFLKDAATGTHLVGFGMGLSDTSSATSHMLYSLDTLANPVVFKTDIRAALTVSTGASTSAFVLKTGSGGALTGTPTQLNNGRIATVSHGPHSGVETLYFTTATRVYAAPTSGILTTSTTWLSNGTVATEVPPGSVNTFAATGALSALEYASSIDKFVIVTSATQRNYVTQYRTDAGQWDRIFGVNTFQIDQSAADATTTPVISQTGAGYTVWCEAGLLYIATAGTTAILNRLYAIPLGADWEYAATTNARLILPVMSPVNAANYVQFFEQDAQVLPASGASGKNLGLQTEPFRLYYRTSGISDNSGSWTLLDSTGVVTGVAGTASVQLMVEFRTIGTLSIPARMLNGGVIYDDAGMSDYWMGSSNIGTNLTTKTFGFYFASAYGTTVPRLAFTLYDAVSGSTLSTDDSNTQTFTWNKSTDNGGNWSAYNTTDRANSNTYIRVTPTSLADNIKVKAVLREY